MSTIARASWLGLVVILALACGARAGHAESRFALVIGNDEYKTARLATPANDAGLVADALQAAGFAVSGARNLDRATLSDSFREFLDQVSAAGPDAVALVYFAGFGLQFEGENYFIPVDADIQRDVDIPLQAIRISDFTQALAALPGRTKIVIVDAARENPFARGGQPLASGLALVDPVPGMAIAFNAAPGTVGAPEPGPYGAYATSLTEMIAAGGLSLDDIFARVRLRVSELTQGAEIPWYASQIDGPFFMTERAADAPPPPTAMPVAEVRGKPMRDFGSVEDAYAAALERDSIDGYEQFLTIYPNSRYSKRVAAMLAVRREEIIWRRCVVVNTPPAYWSYLRRYPDGPHVWDARRRLAILRASIEPAPDFAFIDFGVAPPPPEELTFVHRPIIVFAGPEFAPPPRPPVFFLPPRPREFVAPPPPPPRERFVLPVPAVAAVPAFVRPPPAVAVRPPPQGPSRAPAGRHVTPVSLPAALQHGAPAGGPEQHRPGPGGTAIVVPPHPGASQPPSPPPSIASVKPAPPPPPPPSQPKGPTPAAAKPAPPPPHPGPSPAAMKPAPPPLPPPHPPGPAPAAAKPATSQAKPPAKPTCPPGKKLTPQGCK